MVCPYEIATLTPWTHYPEYTRVIGHHTSKNSLDKKPMPLDEPWSTAPSKTFKIGG